MRVTISRATTNEVIFALVDGPQHLNAWPIGGEVFGLERDGLSGWFDSVDPRVEEMPDLPGQHGSFWPEEVLLASRILTIRGFHARVKGESSTLAVARIRDLITSLIGVALRIRVHDAAGPREVTGYIASKIPLTRVTERGTKFSLIITCPDPLKYGDPVHYPAGEGALTIENTGTGEVAFTISTTSPITSLDVRYGTDRVTWAGSSNGLVLDLADGRPLNLDGFETGYLIAADAIRIPQGQHQVSITADAPLTLTLRPGWK